MCDCYDAQVVGRVDVIDFLRAIQEELGGLVALQVGNIEDRLMEIDSDEVRIVVVGDDLFQQASISDDEWEFSLGLLRQITDMFKEQRGEVDRPMGD